MYPNEFPPEPPPPSVDPTLLLVLVLAGLALTLFAFLLGYWLGGSRREDPAGELRTIREEIDKALSKAQTATGEDVFPKARALSEEVRKRLEGVAIFGGPLHQHWTALARALDGSADHAHGRDDHGHGNDDHDAGGHETAAEAAGPISVSAGTVVIANAVSAGSGGHPPAHAPSHRDKVSAAVRAFAEWWKAPSNPEELKAAQADLLPK